MFKSYLSYLVVATLSASTAVHAQSVDIQSNDGKLSIRASNTSATELADALSQQLGITVVVTGDTETLINVDIIDETLEKAIGQLSPNNMLVRAGKGKQDDIIEIVLMMGDSSGGSSNAGSDEQFLPSGSPADEVSDGSDTGNIQASDGALLRDPNRAQSARGAAEAASSDSGQASEGPADTMFDPVTGLPIDPTTGLPLQPQ